MAISDCVPFFLTPNAILWKRMRNGEADERIAESVLGASAFDFVFLVSTVRAAGESSAVADADAARPTTRFTRLMDTDGKLPQRLHEDGLEGEVEFLVPGHLPLSAVVLVGVANERVRSEVRKLFVTHSASQKVAVYPPWFQQQ